MAVLVLPWLHVVIDVTWPPYVQLAGGVLRRPLGNIYFLLGRVFEPRDPWDFMLKAELFWVPFSLGTSVSGIACSAVALNAPGARWMHRATSAAVIALGSIAIGQFNGLALWEPSLDLWGYSLREIIPFIVAVAVLQTAGVTALFFPNWCVQLEHENRRAWSMKSLLIFTAAVATCVTYHDFILPSPRYWHAAMFLAGCGLLGHLIGCIQHRGLSIVAVLVAMPLLWNVIKDFTLWDFWFLNQRQNAWAGVSAATTTWAICYFHRCDRRRPADENAPPVSA